MGARRPSPTHLEPSDEELVCRFAAGDQEALGPLYSRHQPLVFHLSVQTLDRSAAHRSHAFASASIGSPASDSA